MPATRYEAADFELVPRGVSPVVFPRTKPASPAAIARAESCRGIHNLVLCGYSAVCCFGAAACLHASGGLFDWHRLLCDDVAGTPLRALSVTFAVSKLVSPGKLHTHKGVEIEALRTRFTLN